MGSEFVLWAILPLGAAIVLATISVHSLARDFRALQVLLGIPALLELAVAIWILVLMLQGTWPSFLPHIAIVIVLPIVTVQVLLRRSKKRASP